ncbi:hypothetical protein SS50377_23727 [Spironucleus salmonicida]|uniref:Uncharacterized protein n=1 Tax=Spironucleus salmonicida TaxID=348837 RepID=V6LRT7_9EUKA|nr:hypothetical protein SS50377_23727 [Spironucleus salmonicida]|eukprot:EST46406.1 Hypothetical protein SS50377_13490 [Spironucleus salmonicida]
MKPIRKSKKLSFIKSVGSKNTLSYSTQCQDEASESWYLDWNAFRAQVGECMLLDECSE